MPGRGTGDVLIERLPSQSGYCPTHLYFLLATGDIMPRREAPNSVHDDRRRGSFALPRATGLGTDNGPVQSPDDVRANGQGERGCVRALFRIQAERLISLERTLQNEK